MRPRDLNRLANTTYDVLVIGGGIHGLTCAYEAASRGLTVALVDAGDFGGGTSFNHQKTAHGGLRSLQSLSIGRARESIRERRALARIAPALLRPLPFLMGTYRAVMRSRLALRAAFAIDQRLTRHRNAGLEPELHLPHPRLLSRTATMKLFPGIREEHLTGGAQWYDYQMVENDRLTFAFAAAAVRHGADLANYVAAESAVKSGARIGAVRVRDVLTNTPLEIRAGVVINAAGAAAASVCRMFGVNREVPLVRAMNLVTSKPAADIALAARGPNGRMLTLVPWRGRAVVGTSQSARTVGASEIDPPLADIEQFIAEVNHAFPALALGLGDVTLVHRGLVPATVRGDVTDFLAEPGLVDHEKDGAPGAISVIGTKYTTARAVAERVVALAARRLKKRIAASRTASTILPGAGIADHEALAIETAQHLGIEVPLPVIRHLTGRYAEGAATIIPIMAEPAARAAAAPSTHPSLPAEVLHAIRQEAAMRLSDIVLRRTTVGAAGHPGHDLLGTCARVAAAELSWSPDRIRDEIAAVEQIYAV